MDPTRKLFARKMFRLSVYEAKGSAYQRLFERVMQYRFPGFISIKPYGNSGDRKNDGYIPHEGRYFQVFAPEDPDSKRTAANAARKAANDFAGLLDHWQRDTPIRDFRFAFNDEYRGSPPPLEQAMAAIRKTHKIAAGVFLANNLETEALELPEDELIDIIGTPIPEPGLLSDVDFGVLREVINHVLQQPAPFTPEAVLNAPDFADKIRFNGLSPAVAALLSVGSYQSEAVADYFSKNSTFARQQVRDHLSSMYSTSREKYSAVESAADVIFFDLLARIAPDTASANSLQELALQNAAIVIMAYYFEACDIFEDPNATA